MAFVAHIIRGSSRCLDPTLLPVILKLASSKPRGETFDFRLASRQHLVLQLMAVHYQCRRSGLKSLDFVGFVPRPLPFVPGVSSTPRQIELSVSPPWLAVRVSRAPIDH